MKLEGWKSANSKEKSLLVIGISSSLSGGLLAAWALVTEDALAGVTGLLMLVVGNQVENLAVMHRDVWRPKREQENGQINR